MRTRIIPFKKPPKKPKGIAYRPETTEQGLKRCFTDNAHQDAGRLIELFMAARANKTPQAMKTARYFEQQLIRFRKLQGRMPSQAQPDTYPAYMEAVNGSKEGVRAQFKEQNDMWRACSVDAAPSYGYMDAVHNGVVRDTHDFLKAIVNRWMQDDQRLGVLGIFVNNGVTEDVIDDALKIWQMNTQQDIGADLRRSIEQRAGRTMPDEFTPPNFSRPQTSVLKFKPR